MIRDYYQPLTHITVKATDVITVSNPIHHVQIAADSPALDAMTDLRRTPPITIHPDETLEGAKKTMISNGVRLLFVCNKAGDLLGLITANDLAGERAIVKARATHQKVPELEVGEVMIALPDLEFLEFSTIVSAEVGHVVSTLKAYNRQHALVVDHRQTPMQVIGLFSATQIARQMGIAVLDPAKASTFAEIEAAVAST